ncbi:MAG: hypothetical protein HQK84_06985 [Nitrospinae bacterium]|nr:hypothetical protein [Nitrospinota bacterium]
MVKQEDYFPELNSFKFKDIFNGHDYFWHALNNIAGYVEGFLSDKEDNTHLLHDCFSREDGFLLCRKKFIAETDIVVKGLNIYFAAGVLVEPTALIQSHVLVDSNSTVRHGAYVRGKVIVGEHSTIGHTTEIKNSIFMNHSEAGHFAYLGDSIIGCYVNLGAGTKFANLPFRTLEEKKKKVKKTLSLKYEGKLIDNSMEKLGVIAGDSVEFGCNSVTCPGTFLLPGSMVFPAVSVRKGFYRKKEVVRRSNLV